MKTLFTLIFISAMSVVSLAQGAGNVDWANKQGAIGIGFNTTLGGYSFETPELDSRETMRVSSIGIGIRYNPFDFLFIDANFGIFKEYSLIEEDDPDYLSLNERGGPAINVRIGTPLLGHNSLLSNCGVPLTFSPFINIVSIFGEDYYEVETDFFDNKDRADYNQLNLGLGARVEYFSDKLLPLPCSFRLNFNIIARDTETYEKDFEDWDNSGIHYFNRSNVFGNFGFTVWFN
ncbi:hypothetical protein GYB22_13420 [bacterium]|nr:hypothetical protein [bacterium]